MKRRFVLALFLAGSLAAFAQAPHIYEHDYPNVTEMNPEIRALMDSVSIESIQADIEHLSSYHSRRFDSRYIYEVQDWLVGQYYAFGADTVILHDFKVNKPNWPEETADNIIAVKWGTKTPEEYVICGAHYDSWNDDGTDPDTIRSPGADDNASGVAGILETARLLSRHTFDRTIVFANWCAEEIGLVGSAAYAHDMAEQQKDIVAYFNLDMTGYLEEGSDIHVNLMYTPQDSLLGQYTKQLSRTYFPEMHIWQDWLAWGDSDYSSFNRNGYPAIHPFEDVRASSPFIHTRSDLLGISVNCLEQSKRFTELNLGLVATLAGINHHGMEETGNINVAMYPNPAKETVTIVSNDGLLQITAYNLQGQQVATKNINSNNQYTLNIIGFASGIYVVKITTETGVTIKRLVID